MNSREKIMEMVKDGTLSVEEGLRLLDAIEEREKRTEKTSKPAESEVRPLIYSAPSHPKMLRIQVESANNDRVRVNVPVSLIRAGLDFTKQMKLSGMDVDLKGVDLDLIMKLVEDGQVGELVDVVSAEGDKVRIVVE